MRKKVFGKQLSRNRKSRSALLKSLVRNVIFNGEVTTTLAKAKAVQPDLEKLISYVKKNDLSSRRAAYAYVGNDREVNNTLFSKYADMASKKDSGFTRITKLPVRRGDAAEMAKIGYIFEIAKTENTKEPEEARGQSQTASA